MRDEERKQFLKELAQQVEKYAYRASITNKEFKEGIVEIIEDVKTMLACVTTSAAIVLEMDREKYAVYLNTLANELKQSAMKLYEDKSSDPPRQLDI